MSDPIFINVQDLVGVDDETFAAADSGDRQAQKVMLRKLLTREASANALTTKDWMHWLMRSFATGSEQAMGDALGSIAETGNKGRLTVKQVNALNEMYEQYFGPEEVGEPATGNVLAAFAGMHEELSVIRLFLLADKLASGFRPVAIAEIDGGIDIADKLRSDCAKAFFNAVKAQYLAKESPTEALDAAMKAIDIFAKLAESDEMYKIKLGQTVYLAAQITELAGEPQAGLLLRMTHAEAVEAFVKSQE